ncbi:uncharacterized protein LOC116261774 isoform X2 [Nymphaea colorata]|uniref:uncharacterized protein LOC116261774 isoform X2 n=1 Tax=Nymphaea colorata TaxID=210225 RepID=UPI00214F092E|nr:uncharacterized protein LOC116261774 isoform X2 [Nymphaea colorata]
MHNFSGETKSHMSLVVEISWKMTLRIRASSTSLSLNPAVGKEKLLRFVLGRRLFSKNAAGEANSYILNEPRCNVEPEYRVNASSRRNRRKCWLGERSGSAPSSKENFSSFAWQEDQRYLNVKQLKLAGTQEDGFANLESSVDVGGELSKTASRPSPSPPSGSLHHFTGLKCALNRERLISDTSYGQKVPKNAIIVEKVPLSITLKQLKQAVSIFGEIQSSFVRSCDNGLCSCHIEFKSFESKVSAITAGCVSVESRLLPIYDLPVSLYAAVRIHNINLGTAEPMVHSVCMSCAPVRSLIRSSDCTVDVHFSLKDDADIPGILIKLNNVEMDGCRWLARLVDNDALPPVTLEDSSWRIESQIGSLILDIRKQMQLKCVYLEDLEELHDAIVHLTDCPQITN